MEPVKRVLRRWVFLVLALITPFSFAAVDSDADLNGDAMVTSQDISLLSNCFGLDPLSNSDCAKADIDEDGDIDGDDFSFVSARLGEAYPRVLYSAPLAYSIGSMGLEIDIGDVNGDNVLDVVTANRYDSDISVLLGNGDGSFQAQQRYATGGLISTGSLALGDLNGDGSLDVVLSSGSVMLGNGDGSFQAHQSYATGNSSSLALGDLNGDGSLDVVFSNGSVMLGNGDGSFQAPQGFTAPGNSVALRDLNGDGILDIVTSGVAVLLGNAD